MHICQKLNLRGQPTALTINHHIKMSTGLILIIDIYIYHVYWTVARQIHNKDFILIPIENEFEKNANSQIFNC